MEISHILLASDLSSSARQSYPHAAGLARAFDAKVTLFHVDETAYYGFHTSKEMVSYLDNVAKQIADRLAEEEEYLRTTYELEVESANATGAASQAILQFVDENSFDLVIMSKHGARGGKRLLLGSTSKRVVRHIDVPVLVVPVREVEEVRKPVQYKLIITTTDFSVDSLRGLHASAEFARQFEARMDLMHVLEFPTLVPILPGEPPLYIPKESVEELREFHESRLKRLTEELNLEDLNYWTTIGIDVADTITDAAVDAKADLITIPSHGHGAIRSVLFGSTSEHVIKLARIPVLVFTRNYLKKHYQHVTDVNTD